MEKEYIIGVDIGGTNTRVAVAQRASASTIINNHSFITPAEEGPDYFLDVLEEGIDACLEQAGLRRDQVAGIGCALPGITNATTGTAIFVSNLRGWDGFHLAGELEKRLGMLASVDNDVNAAALGEFTFGAGAGCHSLVYFTVSTGIAAGIVLEGTIWRGFTHAAGELGFFIPDPVHIDSNWQPNGCLELTSAGVGLAKQWRALNPDLEGPISAIDVFDAANRGDDRAVHIVTRASNYLAQTVIALCTIIDPERIVFSGSIAQHQPVLLERCKEIVGLTLYKPTDIVLSALHGDAPMIGSLSLINDALRKAS